MRYIRIPFANSGDQAAVPDQQQASGLVSMETGYTFDYERDKDDDPNAKPIERTKMNYLFNLVMSCIQQYQQNGVPDYITAADNGGTSFGYAKYSKVRYTDGEIYQSLKDDNTDLPTVAGSWRLDRGVDYDQIYPVGITIFFAENKNPNSLFPGTVWAYTGENKTVRLANADGSNVKATGGADSVSLGVNNIPLHSHVFSGSTSTYDYGTKTVSAFDYGTKYTNTTGDHNHATQTYKLYAASGNTDIATTWPTWGGASIITSNAGNHSHAVGIGAHNHTVSIGVHSHSVSGTTNGTGSGASFSVINSYIMLMGWHRTA